jgi:hypothetical protein
MDNFVKKMERLNDNNSSKPATKRFHFDTERYQRDYLPQNDSGTNQQPRQSPDKTESPILPDVYTDNLFKFVLGIPGQRRETEANTDNSLNRFRDELVDYLSFTVVDRITEDVLRLARLRDRYKEDAKKPNINKEEESAFKAKANRTCTMMTSQAEWLFKRLNGDTTVKADFLNQYSADEMAEYFSLLRNQSGFSVAQNARVAALNEMLKRLIQAMDDDLRNNLLAPRLNQLRKNLTSPKDKKAYKLDVGLFQQTKILVNNRSIGRVDPQATFALTPPTQTVLSDEEARTIGNQFTNLAQSAVAGVVAGTNPLAAFGSIGNLTKGLGSFTGNSNSLPGGVPLPGSEKTTPKASAKEKTSQQEENLPPGVYSISTGNVFQVTPIFDPTGQALRFKFDYVAQTAVREPDNSIDPQLPRIERHGVNTDVQLSNQEVRLISGYQSNARLGRPSSRTGGVPVFKNLPLFKEIPLLGWFTRREGSSGQMAESLIFAHTTMFTTIEDIVALLTRPELQDYTGSPSPAPSTGVTPPIPAPSKP